MFATIIVLGALILVTPNLLGHPSELASLPILIVAMTHDQKALVVDVTAFSQAYMYDNITLEVHHLNPDNSTVPYSSAAGNDTYSESLDVPVNATPLFIHTRLVDHQENYFEINVTMRLSTDANEKVVMVFRIPDDQGSTTVYLRTPPDEFRWPVPRKGMLP
jgi:hypothetical protein